MKEALFNAAMVGLGGFLGALARFTVSGVIQKSFLKGVFPISTGLVVQALAQPQWLVEVDIIAVIPDEDNK